MMETSIKITVTDMVMSLSLSLVITSAKEDI